MQNRMATRMAMCEAIKKRLNRFCCQNTSIWDNFKYGIKDWSTLFCFHGAFATGVASQQGTLTLPDTWFRPPFWDLLMLQLLRPNSSNLPCLYSTFHLEYPLVLSRFYFALGNRKTPVTCKSCDDLHTTSVLSFPNAYKKDCSFVLQSFPNENLLLYTIVYYSKLNFTTEK